MNSIKKFMYRVMTGELTGGLRRATVTVTYALYLSSNKEEFNNILCYFQTCVMNLSVFNIMDNYVPKVLAKNKC